MSELSAGQEEKDGFVAQTLSGVAPGDVSFDRLQGVGSGDYWSSRGSISRRGEEYEIQIYEEDSGLYLQMRNDGTLIEDTRLEFEDAYGALPEDDGELYETVREAELI